MTCELQSRVLSYWIVWPRRGANLISLSTSVRLLERLTVWDSRREVRVAIEGVLVLSCLDARQVSSVHAGVEDYGGYSPCGTVEGVRVEGQGGYLATCEYKDKTRSYGRLGYGRVSEVESSESEKIFAADGSWEEVRRTHLLYGSPGDGRERARRPVCESVPSPGVRLPIRLIKPGRGLNLCQVSRSSRWSRSGLERRVVGVLVSPRAR